MMKIIIKSSTADHEFEIDDFAIAEYTYESLTKNVIYDDSIYAIELWNEDDILYKKFIFE